MGYLIFVPGSGWVKRHPIHHKGEYLFTWNRSEAHVWWTFSGVKRVAHKIFGAHIEEL